MSDVNEIQKRMSACIANTDKHLVAFCHARSEQIQIISELADSIDTLDSSINQYSKKLERNNRGIERANKLAHRLEEIMAGAA